MSLWTTDANLDRAQQILACPNRCGGIATSQDGRCGIGVLVAAGASTVPCFSKAINVVPAGSSIQVVQSIGDFQNPRCYAETSPGQLLVNGSSPDPSAMTVAKCVALASSDAWRYAAVGETG